jgi:glycine C-acetyltransferase/8-amino-7-oxononanoate synthase
VPELQDTALELSAIAEELDGLRREGLYRELRVIDSPQGPQVTVDGAPALLFCSNDYLGLAGHRALREAAAEAALQWGAGAGASRLVSGNMTIHEQLERELAEFKGHDSCLLFGSGYLANMGVISALAGQGDLVLSDALNHASIIDGCRLARADTVVYAHRDLDQLAAGLERAGARRKLVVTDAVFSMDGDLAPLLEIVALARRHGAALIVDEAHATGVLGPGGRGLVAALGLQQEVDVVVGTLGKALGSYGAFVCCRPELAELLVNRARSLIFSTALPPPSVAAALAAVRLVREQPEIVERVRSNARLLRAELAGRGFEVSDGETPIVPLIAGGATAALAACEAALARGVFAQAIRPPTVPPGTSRLRLTTTAAHQPEQIRLAAEVLAEVWR